MIMPMLISTLFPVPKKLLHEFKDHKFYPPKKKIKKKNHLNWPIFRNRTNIQFVHEHKDLRKAIRCKLNWSMGHITRMLK